MKVGNVADRIRFEHVFLKDKSMNRMIAVLLFAGLASVGVVGCQQEKSSTKHEMKINTPGGTTTITTEKEVKKTGDNPPAAP